MKKISYLKIFALSLMIMGLSGTLFGQGITLPFQSDFSGVGGSSESSGSSMPAITASTMPAGFLFTGSSRIYAGGQKLKFGVAADVGVLPTDVINTGGATTIEVKFKALAWPTPATKTAKIMVTYGAQSLEVEIAGANSNEGGWPVEATDLIEYTCEFDAISTPTSLFFKTTTASATNECRMFLDDIRITGESGPPTRVATPTFTPGTGTYAEPQNVTISCTTEGATIRYTLDGTDPTPSSPEYSTPITISTQTTLKAKGWKTGLDESLVGMAIYTFPPLVTTLSELRALAPEYNGATNTGTTLYKYTGTAVVTHVQRNNNVKYIQDGTAAIMIFDPSGKLQTGLEVTDKITNISGTLTNYFGMLELIPTENCNRAGYDGQVAATLITLSQLDYDHENPIQAKVVKVEDVFYTQTGNFATGAYYNLKQNNVVYDSVVFTDKWEATYIGQPIPTVAVNIHGICNFKGGSTFATRNRIVPMDELAAVPVKNISQAAIQLAPNPASSFVNIVTGTPMRLEVYGLLGNLMATENLSEGTNTISVSNYPAGIYLMKLTEYKTGKSFMQKLVVR